MMSTKSINFMTLPPPPSAKPTTDLLFKNAQQMHLIQNKCTSLFKFSMESKKKLSIKKKQWVSKTLLS